MRNVPVCCKNDVAIQNGQALKTQRTLLATGNTDMIHVIATVALKPGSREQFLEEFGRVVPLVHNEEGCIAYGPTVDIPTDIEIQGPVRDNVVVIMEQWETLATLESHLVAEHMVDYRPRVKPLIENTNIQILKPAGEE